MFVQSFEDEISSIREICNSKHFKERLEKVKILSLGRPLILYGAGTIGYSVARFLKINHIEVSCFCDRNKNGVNKEGGLPIISPYQISIQYPDANIIVCSVNYKDEITNDLIELGINLDRIFYRDELYIHEMMWEDLLPHLDGYKRAFHLLEDVKSRQILLERIRCYVTSIPITASPSESQYFDSEIIKLNTKEILVDAGMYIGDTAEAFFQITDNQYKHYYGFEPDENNFLSANLALQGKANLTLVKKGLWSGETYFLFDSGLTSSSKLDADSGNDFVEVTSLDEFFRDKEAPTFIKMDIEGAELEALKGAEYLIHNFKPKLAICAYHKPEDLYTLPELIKSFRDDYVFYLRHYTDTLYETVLYAF
ncbi:FkbM family methyltransferase [bacterium 1XD42-1]|nr:FkbM family methyltransferase [bacterium 1XD42-8]RKJ62186.1 FkbM family methyltransferase [bacterium 1XD42-1]